MSAGGNEPSVVLNGVSLDARTNLSLTTAVEPLLYTLSGRIWYGSAMSEQQVVLTSTTSVVSAQKCKNLFLRFLALRTFAAALAFGALRASFARLKSGSVGSPVSLALRKSC